jgi:23S rRNA (uridine2552-2'-O)-methyltransferase
MLRLKGHFLAKFSRGGVPRVVTAVKRLFSRVKVVKPDASRKASREIYILGMHLKNS